MAYQGQTSAKIDYQAFKQISNSNGKFTTWTDIIQTSLQALPINEEILGSPFKSFIEVTGDNVEFSNLTYKWIEWFRPELSENNKMELNKMVMKIYDDFMAPFEFNTIDKRSASEWSSYLAQSINYMLIAKQDMMNMLALDELYKVTLALGNYTIVKNGNELITDPNNNDRPDFEAYKHLGIEILKFQFEKARTRNKFTKGFDTRRLRWVNSPEFSLNLLASQTAGFFGSDSAYKDFQTRNQVFSFLGTPFTRSYYLRQDVLMQEWKEQGGQIHNQGRFNGNLLKPFKFNEIISIAWVPDSLLLFGHGFGFREVPMVNNRVVDVLTYYWRAQAAVLPLLAHFNHVFIDELPTFPAYKTRDGRQFDQLDLKQYDDFIKLRTQLLESQPQLYHTLINPDGTTNDGLTQQGQYADYIQKRTLKWAGSNWVHPYGGAVPYNLTNNEYQITPTDDEAEEQTEEQEEQTEKQQKTQKNKKHKK